MPRSCHKMVNLVIEPVYRQVMMSDDDNYDDDDDNDYPQIFVLGRYLEGSMRDQITDDTATMGGPSLIFDHQMCLDADKRNIYVFGGQSLHMIGGGGGAEEQRYRITLYHFLLPSH